ncbi:hypothetical protein MMC28_003733 [Mycoblastus sanguinarius]|nr:hypothetical protein [Mycoblastus sanguinarius]
MHLRAQPTKPNALTSRSGRYLKRLFDVETMPHSNRPRLSRPPFRFLDLPLEIRLEIYTYCLISPVDIMIELQKSFTSITEAKIPQRLVGHIYTNAIRIEAQKAWYVSGTIYRETTPGLYITTSLLYVSRTISREAAPLLYSLNSFDFSQSAKDCWDAFAVFSASLAATSRSNIRRLSLEFPHYHYYHAKMISKQQATKLNESFQASLTKLNESFQASLAIIKDLPLLKTFTLRVLCDVRSDSLSTLSMIHESRGTSQICLGQTMPFFHLGAGKHVMHSHQVPIRIDAAVAEMIRRWGWGWVTEGESVTADEE